MKFARDILAPAALTCLFLSCFRVSAQNVGKEKETLPFVHLDTSSNIGTLEVQPPRATISLLGDVALIQVLDANQRRMVSVFLDGKVVYGEGYKPDEVARMFWQSMADAYPNVCDARQKMKGRP